MRTALFFQREPERLSTALLLSLLAHALLLSITLGGQTFGLPGLNFPWKERRLGADDLRIQLAPARPAASAPAPPPTAPAETANAMPTVVDKPAFASSVPPTTMPSSSGGHSETAAIVIPTPTSAPTPAIAPAPPPEPAMAAPKRPDVTLPIAPGAPPVRSPALPTARNTPQGSELPAPSIASDTAQKQVDQDTQARALEQARLEHKRQSAEQLRQAEVIAAAQREATRQELLRQDAARAEQTARNEAARMEAERAELARQEGLRREALQKERAKQEEKAQQEAARRELERAEAARRETARQEQARQAQLEAARQAQLEAARQESFKQEAARRDAIAQEVGRQEAAKQEATRQERARQEQREAARQAQLEAARQDAIKQEAARRDAIAQEAARHEAAKQEAARQESARQEQAQRERAEQEAQREERLRAIGKQLNEEAAQRDAPLNRPSRSLLLPTVSSLRRGWLLGRADPNTDLVLYAEAMSRKIEMNMTFDMVREAVKRPHVSPVVTVAIRADGSVEKVTFVVPSGVPAIDEAIRKVVASQAPYSAFPLTLARQYDVIEIRRTWIFDMAIRLQ